MTYLKCKYQQHKNATLTDSGIFTNLSILIWLKIWKMSWVYFLIRSKIQLFKESKDQISRKKGKKWINKDNKQDLNKWAKIWKSQIWVLLEIERKVNHQVQWNKLKLEQINKRWIFKSKWSLKKSQNKLTKVFCQRKLKKMLRFDDFYFDGWYFICDILIVIN